MPKIVIIGGIPESLVNFRGDLIKSWFGLGYTVVAVAAPASAKLAEEIKKTGALFKPIPLQRAGLNPLVDLKAIKNIFRIISEEKPTIVFAYTVKPVLYGALGVYLYKKISYYAMITGLGYAFAGNRSGSRLLKGIIIFLYRMALKRSEVIFFQNHDDRDLFRAIKIIPVNKQAIVTNGSGVNLERFAYRKPILNQKTVFLLIGRLLASKGVREYVEAAKNVKATHQQARFQLVGGLDESPDSIKQKELENWQNEGLIEYYSWTDDVRPYLEGCSVYVLPSFYGEGTPRSVLEAMAIGRAIITTDASGCRETVIEGVNGYLVPVKDSIKLAEAMERFIIEPALIERMGQASRKLAEEKYDVHQVNRVINEALGLL